jgi:hypothetical protein
MGWDDWTSSFNFEEKPDTDEKDVGLKEFEVEEDVIFTVKYKVLAKDKSDLIDKKVYLGGASLEIDKDSKDVGKTYDYHVKNWGTENTKETETGRSVVKEYGTDENGKEDKEDFEIKLDVVYG